MKDELKLINSFFEEVCDTFHFVHLKCGFDGSLGSFIINVEPAEFFNDNEKYIEMEYDFTHNFESRFPDFELLFVSNDPLIKIDEVLLDKNNKDSTRIEKVCPNYMFQTSEHYNCWVQISDSIPKSA